MLLRCWLLVWHTHRGAWCGVESHGSWVALAGGWMVRRLICRVNRHFGSVLLRDGWVAAIDPRHTLKAIKTLDSVISKTQPLVIQIMSKLMGNKLDSLLSNPLELL